MAIILRFLVESDYPQWYNLYMKHYEDFSRTAGHEISVTEKEAKYTFTRLADPKEPMYGLVAEDDEIHTVVGFLNFVVHRHTWTISNQAFINDLFVNETHRNHGIGGNLVKRVYQFADDNKYANVHWMTLINNHLAQKLYDKIAERNGFEGYSRPDAEEQA